MVSFAKDYLNAAMGSTRMADDLSKRSSSNPLGSGGRIALRISVGAKSLHDVISPRSSLVAELQERLRTKTELAVGAASGACDDKAHI
jgi:hypothetical protein